MRSNESFSFHNTDDDVRIEHKTSVSTQFRTCWIATHSMCVMYEMYKNDSRNGMVIFTVRKFSLFFNSNLFFSRFPWLFSVTAVSKNYSLALLNAIIGFYLYEFVFCMPANRVYERRVSIAAERTEWKLYYGVMDTFCMLRLCCMQFWLCM